MEPTMDGANGLQGGAKGNLGPVVQIDEERIQAHLDEVVRSTVEETLNALLDAEADRLCGAKCMSGAKAASIPGRAAMTGSCIPGPAR